MMQGYQVPQSNSFVSMAATVHPTPRPENLTEPQWQIPIYDTTQHYSPAGVQSPEEFPSRHLSDIAPDEARRTSDVTLNNGSGEDMNDRYAKYSFSSYQHPYDIQPPQDVYSGPGGSAAQSSQRPPARRRSVSFSDKQPTVREYIPYEEETDAETERTLKKRGIPSNMLDLYALNAQNQGQMEMQRQGSETGSDGYAYTSARNFMRRRDSAASTASGGSDMLDPDDPRVTGVRARYLEDPEDIEKHTLRGMDYRSRRKHRRRVKIEFNVSCIYSSSLPLIEFDVMITAMLNRQEYLIMLAKALMTFGAPSHRIESQLVAAARILEVEAEFIHLPNVIICSFGDQDLGCSETHFVKCGGRLSLGALHKVHILYRSVVHDEMSAKTASDYLGQLLTAPPLYSIWARCIFAFCLSALICPLAFGGSFMDMWIAGAGALVLAILQLNVATKSAMYANVFECVVV
jgi:uncharacterized membrane protein YjjP (DUF1212 family)